MFYLFVFLPRKERLQTPAVHPPLVGREERQKLFSQCFATIKTPEAVAGWFFDAPLQSLKRENVIDWILWAIFGSDREHRKEVVESWTDEIDDYISRFESIVGHKFAEGRNPEIKSMRVTLDPVIMIYRPFIWYMVSTVVFENDYYSL